MVIQQEEKGAVPRAAYEEGDVARNVPREGLGLDDAHAGVAEAHLVHVVQLGLKSAHFHSGDGEIEKRIY
jgi:hypothetical protein